MHFEVPRYLIYQKIYPGGVRLPKRYKFVQPSSTSNVDYKHRGTQPVTSMFSELYDGKYPEDIYYYAHEKMNFTHEEFRFWCLNAGGIQAICRSCGSVYISEGPRRAHLKEKGCATAVITAYLRLQKDSRCVVCDDRTSHEKWGVPICQGKCTHIFMVKQPTPDALYHALQLRG